MRRLRLIILFALVSTSCLAGDVGHRVYDYYFLEAMVQRQKGNHDAAFDLLQHCIQLNPNGAEAYFYLSQYYSGLKNMDQALACTRRAAELSPDNETYMETLSDGLIARKDYAGAVKVIEKLYQNDKERVDLLEMLFQLYQQLKDYKSAINVLTQLEQIDGKNERLSMAKSDIYMQMGNQKEALAELALLAKQYPNDLNYLGMYGDQLMMAGQEKRALGIFDRILHEEPDNSRVLMSLRTYYQSKDNQAIADSLAERILLGRNTSVQEKMYLLRQEIQTSENAGGDSVRVLGLFKKMLSSQPDADVALLCASYMDMKKMPKDSISPVYHQVLSIAPDNAAARLQLVAYAWENDDMDQVVDLCQAARQYNPDEMAFYYYQGIAYYKQDKQDEALSAFQNGIGVITEESDAGIVSDFYAVMGDILHQKGMPAEAYAAYDSCLQWKDDNIGCLNNYAYYLSEENAQLDKAEQMSYRTVKAEPKNATYLDTYAWILFMQHRYSEAKIYIDQALQNKDDSVSNAVILEHAGDIYSLCGDVPQSIHFWQEALEESPDNQALIKKIKLKKYIKE